MITIKKRCYLSIIFILFSVSLITQGCSDEPNPNSNSSEFTVKFILDSNEIYHTSKVVTKGINGSGVISDLPKDPEKKGYAFHGWYLNKTKTKFFTRTTPISRNISLYGKWVKFYTVTFFTYKGSLVAVAPRKVLSGDILELPNPPEKEYSRFLGWYLNKSFTSRFDKGLPIKKDLMLYAKWEYKSFTFTFYSNGGNRIPPQTIRSGNTAKRPPQDPVRENYLFLGWFKSIKEENTEEFDFENTKIIQRSWVYAKWEIKKIVITYNANGGHFKTALGENKEIISEEILSGSRIVFKLPQEQEKLQSAYWSTDPKLKTKYDFSTLPKNNLTLYMKWDPKTFSIEFKNLNSATYVASQDVAYGKRIKTPPDPKKSNAKFIGWYKSTSFKDKYNFNSPIYENKKVYAYFLIEKLVHFNPKGGSMPDEDKTKGVTLGSPATSPNPPVKENYNFSGWYTDEAFSNKYEFKTPVKSEFTLYAKWISNFASLSELRIDKSLNLFANFQKNFYFAKEENHRIRLVAPGVDLSNITPSFTKNRVYESIPDLNDPQDFSNGPITYSLVAQDGSFNDFEVEISNTQNTEKNIILFQIKSSDNPSIGNDIYSHIIGNDIKLILPKAIDPYTLRPFINTSYGATVSPASGSLINTQSTYTVTAENNSSKTYNLIIEYIKDTTKDITSFTFNRSKNKNIKGNDVILTGDIVSSINGTNISITLPVGSVSNRLIPTITISGISVNPNPDIYQDFKNQIQYTVTAEDSSIKTYTITTTVTPSSNNKIIDFGFKKANNPNILVADYVGRINKKTNVIEVDIPSYINLNLNRLTPYVITEPYVSDVSPKGGQNYSGTNNTITVTAQDGSKQTYTLLLNKVIQSVKEITSFSFESSDDNKNYISKRYGSRIIGTQIYVDDIPFGTDISNLIPSITLIGGGSLTPAPSVRQDFSDINNPVVYTAIAKNNSQKKFSVTINVLPDPSKQILSFKLEVEKNSKLTSNIIGKINGREIFLNIPKILLPLDNAIPTIFHKGQNILPNLGVPINLDTRQNNAYTTYTVSGLDGESFTYDVIVISYESNIAKIESLWIDKNSNDNFDQTVYAGINQKDLTITLDNIPESIFKNDATVAISMIIKGREVVGEKSNISIKSVNKPLKVISFDKASSKSYTLIINTVKSSKKNITSFVFKSKNNRTLTSDAYGTIDNVKNTIIIDMPFGTDISNLLPSIKVTGSFYESLTSQNFGSKEFLNNIEYLVHAKDGSSKSYSASINFLPNDKAKIISFSFLLNENTSLTEVIKGIIKNVDSGTPTIEIIVKSGITINHLKPRILLSKKASITPVAGYEDFTKEVSYTVKAQNQINSKVYTIKTTSASAVAKEILSFVLHPFDNEDVSKKVIGIILGNNITLNLPIGTQTSSLLPRVQISGISYSPNNRINFQGANTTYTVTAEDSSTKVYKVTVKFVQPKTNKLYFNVGTNATPIDPVTISEGEFLPENISTSREGYIFSGWYTDKTKFNDQRYFIDSKTPIKSDLNLFAKWIIKTYTVNFMNQDALFQSTIVTSLENLNPPSKNPEKPSYEFIGWSEDPGKLKPYDKFGKRITKSFFLYALFAKNIFTISFVSLNKTYSTPLLKGDPFQVPKEIVNPNYGLLGWYENSDFSTEFNLEKNTVSKNLTLYAKWGYTVTFDPDANQGGTLAAGQKSIIKVDMSGTLKIPEPSNPTNSNTELSFIGWFYNNVLFDFENTISESLTLKAKWGYTVTFDPNGGTLAAGQKSIIKVDMSETLKIPEPSNPTNSNTKLSFIGWFYNNVLFDFENTTISESLTLKAKWGYTVTFDPDANQGGTLAAGQKSIIKVDMSGTLKIPEPSNPTHSKKLHFLGWFYNGALLPFDFENTTISESLTLKAKWGYRITFKANNGVFELTKDFSIKQIISGYTPVGTPITTTLDVINNFGVFYNDTIKTNYKIIGWTLDAANTNNFDPFNNSSIKENITVYAHWGYIVTFLSGPDGSFGEDKYGNEITKQFLYASAGEQTIIDSAEVAVSIAPKYTGNNPNFTKIGWLDESGNDFIFPLTVTDNRTIYVKWGKR